MSEEIFVTKLDGVKELFNREKLEASLQRSGARPEDIEKVLLKIESELFPGISTSKIYRRAYAVLREIETPQTVFFRYSLRRALSDLGPSGFPFEKFVAELFKVEGYRTEVGKQIKGKCISHELDVIGHREDEEVLAAELKFHNRLKIKTDVKVALYMKARFEDILSNEMFQGKKIRKVIITNTKFTSNAVKYGSCSGVELIGWNYPRHGQGNLHDLILNYKIHPITCLTSLTDKEKKELIAKNYIICRDLGAKSREELLRSGAIPKGKIDAVMVEVKDICSAGVKRK